MHKFLEQMNWKSMQKKDMARNGLTQLQILANNFNWIKIMELLTLRLFLLRGKIRMNFMCC